MSDESPIPPSVQLGEVIPPEDPEDWGRPLTWVLAAGMLAAPGLAAAWFWLAPPAQAAAALPGTVVLAAAAAVGAAIVGGVQRGVRRAVLATIGTGLFSALGLVVVGTAFDAGDTMAVAVAAGMAGFAGSLAAASLAGLLADRAPLRRIGSPAVVGALTAVLVAQQLITL